jgi:ankyrin repeat protein
LWAKLQLDSICKQTRDCDIRDELNHLPRTLYETYDRILERITKEQPDNLQELARRILMWILYAERPLHIDELIEAVAIDTGVSTHDGLKERVYNEDTIFKVTGNLISFNRHHDWRTVRTVKFIHYSVQEYFTNSYHFKTNSQLSNYFTDPYSGHRELASSCMKYLQLDIFAQGPCSRKGEWDDKWRTDGKFRNTLAYYSSFCFDKHIKQLKGLPEDVMIQIESILDKDSTTIGAIIQLRRFGASHFGESEILHNSNLGPAMSSKTLIYSSYLYDFPQFTCIDNRWSKLPMALFILQEAIRKRSERDVYQLLDAFSLSGMNINERDFFGKTPLMLSVIRGHVGITEKLLVDLGADVDLYHSDWFTAFTSGPEYAECTSLYSVCTEGHIAIVELLLKHGADVNLISCSDTPLGKCAYLDNVFIMKLLLKHGAHVNLTPSSGCELWYTALEWACMGNSLNAVKFLLDKEAIITPKAVRIACKECEDGLILDLLLRRGGKATSKALEKATKYKRYERCVYLLAHGAIITPEALKQSWPTEKLNPWIEIEDESGIIKLFKDKVTSRGVTPKTFEEAEKLRVEEMKIFEEAKKLWLEDVKYTSDKRDSFQFDRYIQPLWDSL